MIYFYTMIANGTKHIPKSFHHALSKLQEYNVLEVQNHSYKLKSNFIIGSVDTAANQLFIKSFRSTDPADIILRVARRRMLRKGDIVLAQKTKHRWWRKRKKNKQHSFNFVALLHTTKPYAIAVLTMRNGSIVAIEQEARGKRGRMLHLRLSQEQLAAMPKHCVIKVEVASGQIVEVLGVLDDAQVDEALVLHAYNRANEFSPSLNELASSFGDRVYKRKYPHRVDLSHLPFCVIDPENARDHDDAIYFDSKSRTLYVAIADVSEYVSFESELDKEARKRGFSLYLPHKVLPMLPFALSSGICSLKKNMLRLAMVWEISLDTKARVKKSKLFEAIIRSHANVSYDTIEAFLQGGSVRMPDSIKQWLKAYVPFVKTCRKARLDFGFDFRSNEIQLTLNESMEVASWRKSAQNLAHSIIEESMLLANVESAKMLQHGIFRIHPSPKQERLSALIQGLESMGYKVPKKKSLHHIIAQIQAQADRSDTSGQERENVDGLIIQSLSKATYSATHYPHFGLGFECYTHFTSPIRRYSDLITHRILKAMLHKDKILPLLLDGLHGYARELNVKEKQISAIELHFYQLKMLRHAKKLLETSPTPPVCQVIVNSDRAFGTALDLIPQVTIKLDMILPRFSIVRVELLEVDILYKTIRARVLDSTLHAPQARKGKK